MLRKIKILDQYLILFPLLLAIFVLTLNLNKPFIGQHDFTSAFNGMIAKNYLHFGVWELEFGQVPGFINLSGPQSYYTHYLPLLPLLITFSFSIFGAIEWAERLVPAIFSLIGVISLYLICRKLWNVKVAFFSCLFFILTPMFIYYGNMPVAEPALVGIMLLSFYFYSNWIENKTRKDFIFLLLSLFIGGLIGWPICYLGPVLILHSLLIKKFDWKLLLPQLVLLTTILLIFVHAFILTGNFFGGGLIDTFKNRFAGEDFNFGGQSFNLVSYAKLEISLWQAYFTRTLLILALINTILVIRSKMTLQKASLIALLLFGLAHLILFSRYVFVHDFLNIYLLPFLAISGGVTISNLIKLLTKIHISKLVISLVIIVIFAVFILERIAFTKVLLATNMNLQGVKMAELLNKLQTQNNQAAIVSPRFSDFYGVFTNFYSNYSYSYTSEETLQKMNEYQKYKYVITIDEDIHDQNLYQFLKKGFPSQKINDLTIFTTNAN